MRQRCGSVIRTIINKMHTIPVAAKYEVNLFRTRYKLLSWLIENIMSTMHMLYLEQVLYHAQRMINMAG